MLQIGPIKSLDASDALAMACFHATQLRVAKMKQTQQHKNSKKSKNREEQEMI